MVRLDDKYLPNPDFSSMRYIDINSRPQEVFPLVQNLRFEQSLLIFFLFRLRGMPTPESMSLKGLEKLNFVVLESVKNEGMIIGLIGKFWSLRGGLLAFQAEEFLELNPPGYAKATWSFNLIEIAPGITRLSTETRIDCGSAESRRKFGRYWKLIKPFSGFIRQEMLKIIRKQAEDSLN